MPDDPAAPDPGPGFADRRPGPAPLDPPTRSVEVPLRRLGAWLDGFARRHGPAEAAGVGETEAAGAAWRVHGADGAQALVHRPPWAEGSGSPSDLAALRPAFGVVLIRRAGYAVALAWGREIRDRKVGSRHIHGRTAAGGWSQQRYARRRANQADEIVEAAAGAADRILGGALGGGHGPDLLVTGGDRPLVAAVLGRVQPRVAALPVAQHVGIGTPDAAVLASVVERALPVRIELTDP